MLQCSVTTIRVRRSLMCAVYRKRTMSYEHRHVQQVAMAKEPRCMISHITVWLVVCHSVDTIFLAVSICQLYDIILYKLLADTI